MYTVTWFVHGKQVVLNNLSLERAIVYKRRWRKRKVDVTIAKQCNDVCEVVWRPDKNVSA